MPTPKKTLLDAVPWDEVLQLLDDLAAAGWEKDAALDLVAGILDQALPCDQLVAGPAGQALEAVDGPVIRAVLGLLWALATKEKGRAARALKRAERLAERQTAGA